jgi:LuxR family maltose regulon positive regulatory protein
MRRHVCEDLAMESSGGMGHGAPLVAVKVAVPPARPGTVTRQRLMRLLSEADGVAVIVAPAGWGKTTLLAHWARHQAGSVVAWLTLDETDDEPHRFWTYFVSALRAADPALGGALGALRVAEVDPLDVAVPTVLHELAGLGHRLTVVVDDCHVLTDRRIHEQLEFLVSYLPPRARLVLAGRTDPPLPLARMRARGELTEIRADDLRFDVDEAVPLVAGVIRAEPAQAQVTDLVARTEGWAAGLKLAALAMRGRPGTFPDPDRHVVDYLVAEVLADLPADRREFLLHTSALDRMSGALCDAVLERRDSAQVLAELDRADMFVVPLDPTRTWYRYHRLFRAALRRELHTVDESAEPVLSRRAADWHRATGDVEEAIRYLVAAGDPGAAGQLLAHHDDDFLTRGALGTYLRLGDALPAEVVRADPRLGLALAAAAGFTGRFERVAALLDGVDAGLTENTPPPVGWHSARAAAATLRVVFAPADLAAEQLLDTARAAVDQETDPDRQGWVITRIALGGVLSGLDRNDDAIAVLTEAVRRAPAVDLPAFTRHQAAGLLAVTTLKTGGLDQVRRQLHAWLPGAAAIEEALGDAAAPAVAYLRLAEGVLAHRDGDVTRARKVLADAARLAQVTRHPTQVVRALVALADAEAAGGDHRAAAAALAEADEVVRAEPVLPGPAQALREAGTRLGRTANRAARHGGDLVDPLTDREHAVLRALRGPLNQREIGAELYLSVNTVKGYTKSLYRKLGVASRPDAVRRGRELGLI